MSTMMGYKTAMFMVFFNYAMMTAKYIGSIVFPNNTPTPSVWGGTILSSVSFFSNLSTVDSILTIAMTAGILALFAFSLLIPTIPFVASFFVLSTIITEAYLWQLPLQTVFWLPISMGVAITYYVGLSQFMARQAFEGK